VRRIGETEHVRHVGAQERIHRLHDLEARARD
jgi:hypothetical protein